MLDCFVHKKKFLAHLLKFDELEDTVLKQPSNMSRLYYQKVFYIVRIRTLQFIILIKYSIKI